MNYAFIAIIAAHLIWGANFIVAKLALAEIPPMSLAFARFAFSLILLLPFILLKKNSQKIKVADLPRLILTGVLMVTLNIAFFYEGLEKTGATTASILTMIIPLISVLGGWWFLKEPIYTINLAGIILGFLGASAVLGLPFLFLGRPLNPANLVGNVLIILASISWVGGALISKKLLNRYSTLTLTAVIFLVGALTFLLPAAQEYLQNPTWIFQVSQLGILGFLYITFLSSISAYFLFEWGLGKVGVSKADLFQYLEPLVASFLAVMVLNEKLGPSFWAGFILVAIGVYLSTLAKDFHKHHKAHRR